MLLLPNNILFNIRKALSIIKAYPPPLFLLIAYHTLNYNYLKNETHIFFKAKIKNKFSFWGKNKFI